MAKGEKTKESLPYIVNAEGVKFGPCGDCCFFRLGEGLTGAGQGRCHGAPPSSGRFPAVVASYAGCAAYQPA
jgi:hypothetical protein